MATSLYTGHLSLQWPPLYNGHLSLHTTATSHVLIHTLYTYWNLPYSDQKLLLQGSHCREVHYISNFSTGADACLGPGWPLMQGRHVHKSCIKGCKGKLRCLINMLYLLIIIADPQRNWCAPVTIPWHIPVMSTFEPVVKTFLLYKFRNPIKIT